MGQTGRVDHRSVLETCRALGPYSVIDEWAPGRGWRPFGELVDSPDVAIERVEQTRATLARRADVDVSEIELRAAASTTFLGLVARLASPLLVAAAIHRAVPALNVETLWWQPVDAGPQPIAWSSDELLVGDAAHLAQVFADVTMPLTETFAAIFHVSEQVLRGNVASSLGGALTVVSGARPDHAGTAADLVADVLGRPPLTGSMELHGARDRAHLVRSSCCLYYRFPGGGLCADCVLRSR